MCCVASGWAMPPALAKHFMDKEACMRILRTYLTWMALPAIILVIAVIYMLFRTEIEYVSKRPLNFSYDALSKKMGLVFNQWGRDQDISTYLNYIGTPGLRVEMLIKDNDLSGLPKKSNRWYFRDQRHDFVIRFNDGMLLKGTYKTRGSTSLSHIYKYNLSNLPCFNIFLFDPIAFSPEIRMKKFYLINLLFDPYYFEMEFSYRLLRDMGLFPLYTQFVALEVNGKPQGLYLLVERPEDAIRRTQKGVIGIYRRKSTEGRRLKFETKYQMPQIIERWHIKHLYETVEKKRGKELINELEKIINIDSYLTWLGFNTLVMNPDISDEIYYIVVKSKDHPDGRLEFSAWDYDDLMKHKQADHAIKDPLLFGCEDKIDRRIQREPLLYTRYKKVLYNLLTRELTESRLKAMITEVREEVDRIKIEFSEKEEKIFKAERRKKMQGFEKKLLTRRTKILNILKKDGVESDIGY